MAVVCSWLLAMFGSSGRRIYCPHCKDYLSKSAYYRHRRQFFDRTKKEWRLEVANLAEANSSEDDLEDVQEMHDVNDGSFASSAVSSGEEQMLPTAGMPG